MRLYLAVAVLMLAFVAYTEATEAQDDTVDQQFATFGNQMSQFGRDIADRATEAYEKFKTSAFATRSQDMWENLVRKFQEMAN